MIKILTMLLIFPLLSFAAEDDRKMTPEEMRDHQNRQQVGRNIYPNEYPVRERMIVARADNECYQKYRTLLVTVYNICDFIERNMPSSAGRTMSMIDTAQNVFFNNMALMVRNGNIRHPAMIVPQNSETSRRTPLGLDGTGSPSAMVVGERFHSMSGVGQNIVFAHELGHAYRSQIGHLSRPEGPLVSLDNEFWRPIGWYREEMENVGLIYDPVAPWSTENAARLEIGIMPTDNYNGMTGELFETIEAVIMLNPDLNGWHNFTDFYIQFN